MKPIRVAFVITELDPGGAERALWQITQRLDPQAFELQVICLGPEAELCEAFRAVGIPVRCLGLGSLLSVPFVLGKLITALRAFRPQVVQTWLFHANVLGRVASLFLPGVPVVSGIRVAEKRSNGYLLLERWTQFLATRHVCVSQAVKEHSLGQGGLKAEKCLVIPNGVEQPALLDEQAIASQLPDPLKQLPAEAPIGLMVGRLDPQKGIDRLIQVAARMKEDHPELKWGICGEGPQKLELQELARSMGVEDQILWLGYQEALTAVYQRATFLLFPSRWEGMPNVVLEAMAHGLPVISTPVEGIGELLIEAQQEASETQPRGVVVRGGDEQQLIAELTKAAGELLASPEQQKSFAESSQSIVAKCFTWQKVADSYAQLYQMLVNNPLKK